MARDRGPEEFFEVFRKVQASKRQREEAPGAPDEPGEPGKPAEVAPGVTDEAPQTLTLSYPVAAAFVVGALLLIVAAYLLGKQQGWHAHGDALRKAGVRRDSRPATRAPAAPVSTQPEMVNGKVFTLLTSGTTAQHRQQVELEAQYLNQYEPFRALQVQAYTFRDRSGTYRLCVRGLAAKSPAERETVRAEIRKLRSRSKKLEYNDADFFAP